jgi:hypothetical protein
MPRENVAEYKGREIKVTVIPRLDGHFSIERVGLWSHDGRRTGFTKLTIPTDLTFVTREEAQAYGLALGREAIDRGGGPSLAAHRAVIEQRQPLPKEFT